MTKLMNCAHCGSDNVKLLRTIEDNEVLWHVECTDCGISTISYPEPCLPNELGCDEESAKGAMEDAISSAVAMWNSRANVPCDACSSAGSYDVNGMDDDELMKLYKTCVNALTTKARELMKKIVEGKDE